ncbi:hypothetical protein, partial [Nostoc sp.]|uniref:hypothetical protein n=1 Tax=Nostoc sp. TaxID=1180 RepID=UPI002FF48C74
VRLALVDHQHRCDRQRHHVRLALVDHQHRCDHLTHEANRRMAKLPPGSEEEIINSYFQGKTDNVSAIVTTITF